MYNEQNHEQNTAYGGDQHTEAGNSGNAAPHNEESRAYHDEQNLYHYTYRRDGSEPGQRYDTRSAEQPNAAGEPAAQPTAQYASGPQQPVQEMKPVKKKRTGLKIAALALVCTLLGAAAGGSVAWVVSSRMPPVETAQVQVSKRPATEVVFKDVNGKDAMTDAEVYAANVNSVVAINVTGSYGTNFFGQPEAAASSGSGFILTKDGYIATNYHVVEDAEEVKVSLYDGTEYEAKYVGGDEDYDIAVIKVEAGNLPAVTLGDSDALHVGDRVLAIGNPLGDLTFSMTGGMVSSVNRAINVSGIPFNMIQTDASINPGNSGGPLFNSHGEVVGIVSAKYSSYSNEAVEGLGFAIPMNDVCAIIEDIMTNGYVTNKPYLGITGGTMTQQMAAQYRYDISTGVFVYSVEEGGAAQKAGLQMGDVIIKVEDDKIETMEDLTAIKKKYSSGDTVTLTIYRKGQEQTVELTWDAVPAEQQTPQTEEETQTPESNQGGGQYGGGYYRDPFDIFDYFFGNRYGGY